MKVWENLKTMMDNQISEVVIENLVDKGTLTLLTGKPRVGKTTLLNYLKKCIEEGVGFLSIEFECNKNSVLQINDFDFEKLDNNYDVIIIDDFQKILQNQETSEKALLKVCKLQEFAHENNVCIIASLQTNKKTSIDEVGFENGVYKYSDNLWKLETVFSLDWKELDTISRKHRRAKRKLYIPDGDFVNLYKKY